MKALCSEQAVERVSPGFRLHEHARAATVWAVVYSAVLVVSEIAKVMGVKLEQRLIAGLAEQ